MLDMKSRELLQSLPTPLLNDAMFAEGIPERHLDWGIRPVIAFSKMVGAATTVRLRLAANEDCCDLMELENVYRTKSESSSRIIVIEVPTELHAFGIVGDGAATMGRRNGFVGALVEGAVRDTHALKQMDFPAFCRTISPGMIMGKASIASAGEPVHVGGQTIHEGDVIAADNDGVVVIRDSELDRVIARASAIHEREERGNQLVAEGKSWKEVEEILGPRL